MRPGVARAAPAPLHAAIWCIADRAADGTELVFGAGVPTDIVVRHQERWTIDREMPADWPALVHRLGGGFFHTPLGLRSGAPDGEPIYARFCRDGEVAGLALGVRTPCRLGGHFRHYYFPTWPIFADPRLREQALNRLIAQFRTEGVAEARWDSFDANAASPPAKVATRWEYLLDLTAMDEQLYWPPTTGHRRSIRRGEKSGWQLREVSGLEARSILSRVLETAVLRHARRGVHHPSAVPPAITDPVAPGVPWDVRTYAAFDGDVLLAAILVGRCDQRAYYLSGGATEAGYAVSASVWLQAQVISRLAGAGLREYNLGGAARHAPEPNDPDHGLHRFKAGFGTKVVPCAGDRWILLAGHLRGHQLFGWASGLVP